MERALLLLPTTTYRTQAFLDAAGALGVEIVCASERPNVFEERAPDRLLTLDFDDPDAAAEGVRRFAETSRIDAVVGVDDRTTVVAAAIAVRARLIRGEAGEHEKQMEVAERSTHVSLGCGDDYGAAGGRTPEVRERGRVEP